MQDLAQDLVNADIDLAETMAGILLPDAIPAMCANAGIGGQSVVTGIRILNLLFGGETIELEQQLLDNIEAIQQLAPSGELNPVTTPTPAPPTIGGK